MNATKINAEAILLESALLNGAVLTQSMLRRITGELRRQYDAIEALESERADLRSQVDSLNAGFNNCQKERDAFRDERNRLNQLWGDAQALAGGYANENLRLQAQIASAQTEVERLGMALRGYQVAIETAEESLKDRVALAMEVDRLSAAGVSHCGHRPPCVECSKYAAPIPQQPVEAHSVDKRLFRLQEAVIEMYCDWKKGDFALPRLAQLDLEACFEAANCGEIFAAHANPRCAEG